MPDLHSRRPEIHESILGLLRERGNRVASIREIVSGLASRAGDGEIAMEKVSAALDALVARGDLVEVRGKRYSLVEHTPYAPGRIRIRADGSGTVRTDRGEILVDRRATKGSMNGDLVLVRVDKGATVSVRGREYLQGEVSRILERAHSTVVGRFHAGERPWVRPFDTKIDTDIRIEPMHDLGARDGEMVDTEIVRYPGRDADAMGRVIETLGFIWEPGVDVEVVIRKYDLPHRFPEEVAAEAEEIPIEIDAGEIARRTDLRDRDIVTIDGELARDFDDAVDVAMLPGGNYRLGVHIADVSHYVREGSPLDLEALERGTSVYFPGRVVPMLPERLSNGVCSLNPRVDRLTVSVEIEIDRRGRFVDHRIFRSVIRTRERMTYTDVHALLKAPTPDLTARYEPLLGMFGRMHELFEILRKRRDARGSIDFDLPQHEVLLSESGEIETIRALERNVAHRLIEEFMLAANEVVARELSLVGQPALFRVHEQPDAQKIEDLKSLLEEFDVRLRADPEELRSADLQRVIRHVAGRDEERFLSEIILRAMKRALYSPECSGHFALALDHYCHFTSPIRRYPDLVVHRRLAALLDHGPLVGDPLERANAIDPGMAGQASERERRAEAAEREVVEWKKVIFMRDRVGERFEGTITGVVPFGLFIELREWFVQGLVPIATIGGDYWIFLDGEHRLRGESTSREFRLGDPVVVEVRVVDEDRRQIEFGLVEASGVEIDKRKATRRRGRRSKTDD